jgi:hypothetical protein
MALDPEQDVVWRLPPGERLDPKGSQLAVDVGGFGEARLRVSAAVALRDLERVVGSAS